jgi:hypothetical protein
MAIYEYTMSIAQLTLLTWRWRQHVFPKCWQLSTMLAGVAPHKTFIHLHSCYHETPNLTTPLQMNCSFCSPNIYLQTPRMSAHRGYLMDNSMMKGNSENERWKRKIRQNYRHQSAKQYTRHSSHHLCNFDKGKQVSYAVFINASKYSGYYTYHLL